ncbi:MAG: hypothetical protein KME20_09995 [Kaiparowitsia implicata GSE-PSE-MK54-09C]|jgi:uncharacterized protein YjiS (DUF1127 family)|nr:hypothetical protein [Kaiparowitsia implicata GSE-PSE-MK54-09C]
MSNLNTSLTTIAPAAAGRASGFVPHPSTLGRQGRPLAAAEPANLLVAFALWITKAQTARSRRAALLGLLELDRARLDDLGISRDDLINAMTSNARAGSILHAARARNSSL